MPTLQLIGMVHLNPLPGSPGYRAPLETLINNAVSDATVLERAGFDAVLVENYGDAPYFADTVPGLTVAVMTRVVSEVRNSVDVPVGVNVLRNDAVAALSIAAACEARFIRVNVLSGTMYTDQGVIEGKAALLARMRASLDHDIEVLADVFVKHATPPAGLRITEAAADLWHRAMADALIVSGPATGSLADLEVVKRVRTVLPGARLLVGSGVTVDQVPELVGLVDGVIVGTDVKRGGSIHGPVDPARAMALVRAVHQKRQQGAGGHAGSPGVR